MSLGKIPCAHRNCDELAEVRRFASRSDDPKKQRFTGKLYAVCPLRHRTDDQEYILNFNWDTAAAAEKTPPPATVETPAPPQAVKTPEKPAPAPLTTSAETPAPVRSIFGDFKTLLG